jgi:Cellulase (glycosyl hydrolase family 5).
MKKHTAWLRHAFGLASLLLALPLATTSLRGALIAYDNFDTYVPGPLNGLNGGTGWSGAWSALAGAEITHETIPAYEHGTGTNAPKFGKRQSLRLSGNAQQLLERAVPSANGETRYVSFVFRIVKPGGAVEAIPTSTNRFSGWQARDGNPSPSNDSIGFIGLGNKAGARVASSDATLGSPTLNYNQTYFCVIKYFRESTNYTSVRLWINPAVGGETTTNSVYKKVTTSGAGSSAFTGLCVRTVGLGESGYHLIDDLRIGTTWSDVTSQTPADGSHSIGTHLGWAPYQLAVPVNGTQPRALSIVSGSVFDWSALNGSAAAGANGFIKKPNNHHFTFQNAPNTPVRFVGVNLCYAAQFLEGNEPNLLADDLKRSGYNAVRLHHFDDAITDPDGNSFKFNTGNLAKLDALFRALKSRGIYITIDLFSDRKFGEGEVQSFVGNNIHYTAFTSNHFKALLPINAAARASWQKYANDLLNYVHPARTSEPKRWLDDPALIGICTVNEDNLYKHWATNAYIKSLYDDEFDDQKATTPGNNDDEKLAYFIFKKHRDSEAQNIAFLNSLRSGGIKPLITGANYGGPAQALVDQRMLYDYVDEHIYHNHPDYEPGKTGAPPITSGKLGSLVQTKAELPRNVMASRIFNKPFTISEWNFSRPSKYRGEAAVLMPTLASLQDWNGLFCFQYGHTKNAMLYGEYSNSFSVTADPINLVTSRLAGLIFRRGDFKPAPKRIAWAVRENEMFAGIVNSGSGMNNSDLAKMVSPYFWNVGLVAQIGMLKGSVTAVRDSGNIAAAVTGTSPGIGNPPPGNCYTSDTGIDDKLRNGGHIAPGVLDVAYPQNQPSTLESVSQSDANPPEWISLDSVTGVATAVSNRSELFALPPGAQAAGAQVTSIRNHGIPASVCIVAVDTQGHAIGSSSRLLVAHLTDSLPQGATFSDADRKVLTSWGGTSHMVARGKTELTIRLATPSSNQTWKAHVIDHTGRRVGREIPMVAGASSGGKTAYTLTLETVTTAGTQLLYELFRGSAN